MQQFFKQFYSIIDLEDFLNDYFKFYKRVYGIEYYYQEYFNALMSMDKYLKKRNLNINEFSLFQQDLIKLGFLNGFKTKILDSYININYDDKTMEDKYQLILNSEN